MSDQMTEQPTRGRRRDREREQVEQAGQAEQAGQNEQTEKAEELTEAQKAEAAQVEAIKGFATADEEVRQAAAPQHERKAPQLAMDAVAVQAYQDWIKAGRPTTWKRLPVITYFRDPTEVAEWRKMIRKACEVVPAESYEKDGRTVEPSGVRARFGSEFTLTPKMATKIGHPEAAGKTVLAWAAVDKRTSASNGEDS